MLKWTVHSQHVVGIKSPAPLPLLLPLPLPLPLPLWAACWCRRHKLPVTHTIGPDPASIDSAMIGGNCEGGLTHSLT